MKMRTCFWGVFLGVVAATFPAGATPPAGAVATGRYRNLFQEYLGKSEAETEVRLHHDWQQLVAGDPENQRLVYVIPGDMAYIPDIAHHDVRTEGLSYGMMIAVQMNDQPTFDRLWRFAKHFMYHDSGPYRGYFAWHTDYTGRQLSAGPAPDGEEWFVMALFFAAHRWGNRAGILDYGAQAQSILHTMLHKHDDPDRRHVGDMFDRAAHQVVFVPEGPGATFTDPSYHLPAFYELWAKWAENADDRGFLAELAPASRKLFRAAANPKTGLMPDYATFTGAPYARWGHEHFLYDAWRTLANPALDHAWWRQDPWEVEQSNRVLQFIAGQGPNCPDRFKLDGTPVSDVSSPGLFAMAAVAALAADRNIGQPFVQRLWDTQLPDGYGRYYDGLLTMLALLEVSGHFRVYAPPPVR